MAQSNMPELPDPSPNKVRIDRRGGAGLAVHNAYEECLESKEELWSLTAFSGSNAVRDTSQSCDTILSRILPSKFLCNPFVHVELFGKGVHIVCETGSFGAPLRDEFLLDPSEGTRLTFSQAQLDAMGPVGSASLPPEASVDFVVSQDMYLVVQVLDDEGAQGRDRVIGESIVTLSNFDLTQGQMNYLELPLYEPRNLRYCGSLQLSGSIGNDGGRLDLDLVGMKWFRDDNAYLVKDDTYTETRNDLLIMLAWFAYMLVACGLYVWIEGFSFGIALYVRIVTAFTVGYGDIFPTTREGKILNMVFIIVDTITLGYIVGKAMKYIIRLRERKKKENEAAEMENELNEMNENVADGNVSNASGVNGAVAGGGAGGGGGGANASGAAGSMPGTPGDMGSKQMSGSKSNRTRPERAGSIERAINYQGVSAATSAGRMHEESKRTRRKLGYIGLAVLGYIIVGTVWYVAVEEYTFAEAFEWNFVTLSTVGYGNVTPNTDAGRVFTCVYIITGVTTLAYFATTAFEYYEDKKAEKYREQMISGALINEAQLLEFDQDGDGKIDKYEFLAKMVVMTGECEQETIDDIMQKFNELDEDGGGTISVEELRKFEQQAAA